MHEVIVQIKADESETISEDSVTVVRVLLNANCDAKVNDCLRYGMNLDEAIKELGQATATILAMDPEDYSKGQTVLCWEMGSYEIVISASDGIVTEIDIHMLD